MPKIYWTDPAVEDLDGIFEFIAFDSPHNAKSFVQRLVDTTKRLDIFPYSGRLVPEFKDASIREIVFENYRVIYKVIETERIDILAVFLGARDIEKLFEKY